MRVATAHDLLLVTHPVNPVSVLLAPAASVPKSAVGIACVHPPPLPHAIVGATAAATPCSWPAVSAREPPAADSQRMAAPARAATATVAWNRRATWWNKGTSDERRHPRRGQRPCRITLVARSITVNLRAAASPRR